MNKFRYAQIDVKKACKDFHERAKVWDDNYVRFMKYMVDLEYACRIGDKTFSREIEDIGNKSVVVGSCQPEWLNEVK